MYWDVFKFAKQVILNPNKALKKTATVKESVKYIAVLSLVYAILTSVLMWLLPAIFSFARYGALGAFGFLLIPFFIIGIVVGSLIGAGIIHALGKLFRILPKDFSRTYAAVVYAETPSILFGWIPFVNFFAGIWGLVLEVMALKRQHSISTGKAILAIVVPLILIVVVAAMFAYWASGFVRSSLPVQ